MWQPVEIVGGESPLDMDVAVLQPAELLESLLKCCDPPVPFRVGLRAMHQDTEAPDSAALLRARRKRPRRRATEKRDELAAFHSITSSASASRLGLRVGDQLEFLLGGTT